MEDSSIINISGKNAPISLVFCMEIFTQKVASNPTSFGWVCLELPSHAQICLDLTVSVTGWTGGSSKDSSEWKISLIP